MEDKTAQGKIEAATMPIPYEVRDRSVDVKLEEKQIDYVLDELEGYDKLRDDAAGTEVRANLRKTTANLILVTPP